MPDIGLALRQLGCFSGARQDANIKTLAPARGLLAHGVREDGLEGNLDRAAVVVGNPAGERQHAGRDLALLADDVRD